MPSASTTYQRAGSRWPWGCRCARLSSRVRPRPGGVLVAGRTSPGASRRGRASSGRRRTLRGPVPAHQPGPGLGRRGRGRQHRTGRPAQRSRPRRRWASPWCSTSVRQPPRRRRRLVAGLAAGILLAATACSGSDDASPADTSPATTEGSVGELPPAMVEVMDGEPYAHARWGSGRRAALPAAAPSSPGRPTCCSARGPPPSCSPSGPTSTPSVSTTGSSTPVFQRGRRPGPRRPWATW